MTKELGEAEFSRMVEVRAGQIGWFLGAGASAAAGVPTAGHMIADFKANLFASDQRLKRRDVDMDDPLWADRVHRYFDDAHGFPPLGDSREYEAAFTRMYPSPDDRRRYIATAVERASPSYGQRVLAALMITGRIPVIFTTNFDALIESAAGAVNDLLGPGERHPLRVSSLTDSDVAERVLKQGDWPLLAKIHGDYRSDALKNTSAELREQDATHRLVLTESGQRFGLAVAGYSGRDDSVMDALFAVLEGATPFPNGLFWVVRTGDVMLHRVEEFLAEAERSGVETHLVRSETFDELLAELGRQTTLPPAIESHLDARRDRARVTDVRLPTVANGRFPALRFNALPVLTMPDVAMTALSDATSEEVRSAIRERRARVEAVSDGLTIRALGDLADFEAIAQVVAPTASVGSSPLRPVDVTVDHGLLLNALGRALAHDRPLRFRAERQGGSLRISDPASLHDTQLRAQYSRALAPFRSVYGNDLFGHADAVAGRGYAEAVRLRLERRLEQWWLIFEPFTWTERSLEREVPDPFAAWLRQRWFKRRNREWAAMVEVWAKFLAPHLETRLDWPNPRGATFTVGQTTAWSAPGRA